MISKIYENEKEKCFISPDVNYYFNKETGYMVTWGKTKEDDPDWSPYGPFIADIEVTSSCNGPGKKLCPFCYKSNNPNGHNMTLETFKKVFDKFPKTLTQIAFGADAQCITNPDLFNMMKYARENDVIPNITVADISESTADKLAKYCGAVAVSVYKCAGKDYAYNSIEKLLKRGMKQINIHLMLSSETLDFAYEVMNDYLNDPRLCDMNAIVFLSLKKKGRGEKYNTVNIDNYKCIVDFAMANNIAFGFDSCSAPAFIKAIKGNDNFKNLEKMSESCESTAFSTYINVKGQFFPCSFTEKWEKGGWAEGIDVVSCNDFLKDIWLNEKTIRFRNNLIDNKDENGCRNCPAFEVCGTFMERI